jgi:hypothetical protein
LVIGAPAGDRYHQRLVMASGGAERPGGSAALFLLRPSHKPVLRPLGWVVIWYVIAKVFEQEDWQIYSLGGWVSGHTLKHLAAGVSTFYLVKLFRVKYIAKIFVVQM